MNRWEETLIDELDLDRVDLYRLALALAVAERRGALPGALRGDGRSRDPDPEVDLDGLLAEGDSAGGALAWFSRKDDPRRLLARGLGILDDLAARSRDGAWGALRELGEAFVDRGGTAAAAPAGVLAVPVARTERGEVLRWAINAEGGRQGAPHAGIAGMTGQGKSQLLMQILAAAGQGDRDLGMLVLDYKGDLAKNSDFLAATGLKPVRPGHEPLPVNPFHLPGEVPPALVARALTEVFAWASRGGLGDVQRHRAEQAMQQVYEREGPRPSLRAVRQTVHRVYEEAGAKQDKVLSAVDTITGARMFMDRPSLSAEDFLRGRWLVELQHLQGIEVLFALVLMHWLHQVVRSAEDAPANRDAGPPPRTLRRLRTVIAVDEAHYYLRGKPRPLLDLVRIGRSKGVAVLLSTQSVGDFQDHDVLREQLPTLFLFRHGQAPPAGAIQGVLGIRSGAEARRAADRLVNLEQFEMLTTAGGSAGLDPLHALPFYRHKGRMGGFDG